MKKVITYQTPSGHTINLTPKQVAALTKSGQWPRNNRGEEYCSVRMGLHRGTPTVASEEPSAIIAAI